MTGGTRASPSVVLVHRAWADPPVGMGRSDACRTTGIPSLPRQTSMRRSAPDSGHYGWEDAEEYRSHIVDWVSGGYKCVAAE